MIRFSGLMLLAACWVTPLVADYAMAPIERILQAQETTLVDATVTHFNARGHAVIKTHHIIKGSKAPKKLTSVFLSCTGPSPQQVGLQAGKRYVILLRGDAVYEGGTFWAVTPDESGALQCHYNFYAAPGAKNDPRRDMPVKGVYALEDFKQHVRRVVEFEKQASP